MIRNQLDNCVHHAKCSHNAWTMRSHNQNPTSWEYGGEPQGKNVEQ